MNKLNSTSKLIILAVVVVLAVVLIVVYGSGPSNTGTNNGSTGSNSTSTASTTGSTGGTGTGGTAGTQLPPITLITPVPGESWRITSSSPIAWDREAGVGGQIDLLDASTNKLVGVIVEQLDPHQKSYMWNARDIFLSRTSPSKTTVVPGRYVVKIVFDGNGVASVTSQPFNIIK